MNGELPSPSIPYCARLIIPFNSQFASLSTVVNDLAPTRITVSIIHLSMVLFSRYSGFNRQDCFALVFYHVLDATLSCIIQDALRGYTSQRYGRSVLACEANDFRHWLFAAWSSGGREVGRNGPRERRNFWKDANRRNFWWKAIFDFCAIRCHEFRIFCSPFVGSIFDSFSEFPIERSPTRTPVPRTCLNMYRGRFGMNG